MCIFIYSCVLWETWKIHIQDKEQFDGSGKTMHQSTFIQTIGVSVNLASLLHWYCHHRSHQVIVLATSYTQPFI